MKKVIFTGFSLMAFAAASFAQNNATYTGVGTGQTSTQNQSGNLLNSTVNQSTGSSITNVGNYAQTTQGVPYVFFPSSKNNDAFINQIGTKSGYAVIGQEGGQGGLNTATINQKNNAGGSGTAFTAANAATINNAGNVPNTSGIIAVTGAGGNYANAYQEGSKEQVTINQNNGSSGNYADSRQDNYNDAASSQIVTIDQNDVSTNNKATANQFGDQNKLSITQSDNSSGNTADVRQGFSGAVGGPNTTGATATVEQKGGSGYTSSGNNATVLQAGTSASTTKATLFQNTGLAGRSELNVGSITQRDGEAGTATVNQSNWSYNNKADIQQLGQTAGSNNTAVIDQTQNSHDNRGFIVQQGNTGNSATISQEIEVANNDAFINQGVGGSSNTASVKQTYAYGTSGYYSAGNGNTVTVNQDMTSTGSGNKAVVLQGGEATNITNASKITIDQDDSFNGAYLTQTGQTLTATVKQTGNYNLLKNVGPTDPALQLGSGYTLKVTQSVAASGITADAAIHNTASVNSNNIGGGGVTITQVLTNN